VAVEALTRREEEVVVVLMLDIRYLFPN